jgi:hypothetical protein
MGIFDINKEENSPKVKIIYKDGSTGEAESDFLFKHFHITEREEDIVSLIFPENTPTIKTMGMVDCKNLKSIVISEGTEKIDGWTFSGLQALESVSLPESLTTIGDLAFLLCTALPSIVIPKNVKKIGEMAFGNCKELADVNLPEGLEYLGNISFEGCEKLTSVTIPSTVKEISGNPFAGCYGIKISVAPENKHFTVIDNNIYSYNQNKLVAYTDKKGQASFTVPKGVTSIGTSAFRSCKDIKNITFHKGIKEIGHSAFSFCDGITEISLPSVSKIEDHTFCRCEALESIAIPSTIEKIGKAAFFGCKALESITLPAGLTAIGDEAFNECESLKEVYFNGSKRKWEKISIGQKNDALKNAKIHFKTLFGYTK